MIPDCEGWWWIRHSTRPKWRPEYVSANLTIPFGPHGDPKHVSFFAGCWGERLYTPDEFPRYIRLTKNPVCVTHTTGNGLIHVDYDSDAVLVGIEILHAEKSK